jgi:hypothetical protein
MKTRLIALNIVTAACLLGLLPPFAAFAEDTNGLTRAQVRQDLAAYRCAGFNPVADEITYPADVDLARARVEQGDDCTKIRRSPPSPRVRDIGQSR